MITADGCRSRRRRFLEVLKPTTPVLLGDSLHLRYLANVYVDPLSLSAEFGALLLLKPDGHATLFHDNRLPKTVDRSHIEERVVLPWYDGQTPGQGPRGMRLRSIVDQHGGRVHDSLVDPQAPKIHEILADLRRVKDEDEIAMLRACMKATDAGHAWARANVQPGMTELDVYAGISAACHRAAGEWAVVYGDFVICPGPGRRVGPATPRVLRDGELLIVDFSVVIQGYRSDFTNTIAVGGTPSAEQQRLMHLCLKAMAAGEWELRAGARCQAVYDAVTKVFAEAGVAEGFPHHAGHGLGVSHPEAPYIVRESTESLRSGDVITLEPGLYFDGLGGMRIERNYRITETGFERLSQHHIGLT